MQLNPDMAPPAVASRFDWVTLGYRRGPHQPFDADLYDFEAAAVIPTIGALVPGWVLLVPRIPLSALAAASTSERAQVLAASNEVAQDLSSFGGQNFFFEHGAAKPGSVLGCGVEQAHLHLVNLDFDLVQAALALGDCQEWTQVDTRDPWASIPANMEYYLVSNFHQAYVTYPTKKESQYFRKVMACRLGLADQWDYRMYPHERHARQTIQALGTVS